MFIFQTKVFKFLAIYLFKSYEKKFQFSISKIMPFRPKNMDMGCEYNYISVSFKSFEFRYMVDTPDRI